MSNKFISLYLLTFFITSSVMAEPIEHWPGFTGRYSIKFEGFYLESLNPKGNRDAPTESNFVTEARARFLYTPSTTFSAYLDSRLNLRYREQDNGFDDDTDNQADIEIKELWVEKKDLFIPSSFVRLGRSKLIESRSWWWDDEFESLRLGYDSTILRTELGIGERLTETRINEDERLDFEDNITWIFGTASYQWRHMQFIEGRVLYQLDDNQNIDIGEILDEDDQTSQDNDLFWVGLRLKGDEALDNFLSNSNYWVDFSYVTGDEDRLVTTTNATQQRQVTSIRDENVDGFAIDVGITTRPESIPGAAITLSYAYGEGDSDNSGFRQPVLHRNKSKFSGHNRFRTYGEVLRPNLSNLHIFTAGFGYPLGSTSWLETVYHYYRQDDAINEILDSRLRINPDGRDKDIGQEIDFIFGNNLSHGLSFEIVGGAFLAGSAFDTSDDLAYRVAFKVRYDF